MVCFCRKRCALLICVAYRVIKSELDQEIRRNISKYKKLSVELPDFFSFHEIFHFSAKSHRSDRKQTVLRTRSAATCMANVQLGFLSLAYYFKEGESMCETSPTPDQLFIPRSDRKMRVRGAGCRGTACQ